MKDRLGLGAKKQVQFPPMSAAIINLAYLLADYVPLSAIDPEVREVLDAIEAVADSAQSA